MRDATIRSVVALALVMAAWLLPAVATAATRYVVTTGSNTGNPVCAAASPCATIAHAVAVAESGDTVQIGQGMFVEAGGVFVDTKLTITGAGIFSTHVLGASWGGSGSVFHVGPQGDVRITALQIRQGHAAQGGGIYNAGSLSLDEVWVRRNEATSGGGIYNAGFLLMTNGEIALNRNGGLHNASAGVAVLSRARIAANDGPGAMNSGGLVIMRDVLVAANLAALHRGVRAGSAGIGSLGGRVVLRNVTISGNEGIAVSAQNGADFEVTHGTVTNNAFGLFAGSQAGVSLVNTILSGNTDLECQITNASVAATGSLVATAACLTWPVGAIISPSPGLAPLAANGHHLLTHALLPDSPAVDAADDGACLNADQRGVTRPRDGNADGTARCDIGAFERAPGRDP